jgi:hypothetical protein
MIDWLDARRDTRRLEMDESVTLPEGWRYGIHEHAEGATIRTIGRVDLELGDALRIELAGSAQADPDLVHLQYFIATDAGGWALWISCPASEVAENETMLAALTALPAESS